MVGYNLSALPQRPGWLDALLTKKFFIACSVHANVKKNERNIFCVDCNDSICQHCLPGHRTHHLIQIRRYVYHDVIRLQDIQKLIDCSQVQTYIINSARVVFLNQRPQPRPSKLGNACETCDRSLQDLYRYCSVACKVDAVIRQGQDLRNLIPKCNSLMLLTDGFSCTPAEIFKYEKTDLEEDLCGNSTLDDPMSQTSSGSSANHVLGNLTVTSSAMTTPPTKKSRSSRPLGVSASTKILIMHPANRRKGIPHRSPFC
ncbi:hypothetical protein O6H91_02G013600 [Diphasiastrum complanatum]|uniref:Uncharacterized protein n=1 Tax=Diphasiastrum complanatum TaxID=34168 RepID=A0ACC2ECV7_DIPCM|nr:hypothetical protein O6H91_02G013600 [Diphasiastrum complanatum]